MDNFTDEQIVEIVRTKDAEAFVVLVKRYEEKLIRYATYIANDHEIAKEAVQEAFIKAYTNLQGFNVNKKFSSWIYRIVHNETVNKIKKEDKSGSFSFHGVFEDLLQSSDDVELEYEKTELKKRIRECISNLPLKYAEPIALMYLEDKSYEEISDILRLPTSTVGTRIRRGKKLLKEKWTKKYQK